jgi:hypothetical protein
MGAEFDDIFKNYMLSYVDKDEYSADDYKNGSVFMANMLSKIKGALVNSNEDLQYLAKNYLMEKVGLNENELNLLANRLMEK